MLDSSLKTIGLGALASTSLAASTSCSAQASASTDPGDTSLEGACVFATLQDAAAAEIPAGVSACLTNGHHIAGIGGATYKRVDLEPTHPARFRSADRFLADGTSNPSDGGWWELSEPIVSVDMLGADPSGSTDSTSQIQQALDLGKPTLIGAGRYLVSKTLIVRTAGQQVFGITPHGSNARRLSGSTIKADVETFTGDYLISIEAPAYIYGIALNGGKKGTTTLKAIRCQREANTDDMDTIIKWCQFDGFVTGISYFGRGLQADDNAFALLNLGIELFWPSTGVVTSPGNAHDETAAVGFRAIRITNNRVHAVTLFVSNRSEEESSLRGLHLIGNHMDVGDAFYHGGGNGLVISNNVIDQTNAASVIRFTGNIADLTLTGNLIRGDSLGQGLPFELVGVRGSIKNSNISGNSFVGARAYGMSFLEDVEYVTISNNTFADIGFDGKPARSCLRFSKRIDNCCITGNTFNPGHDPNDPSKPVAAIIAGVLNTTRISGSAIIANAYDRSKGLITKLIDDGDNSIQS